MSATLRPIAYADPMGLENGTDQVARYNFVIGTQTIGAAYQFGSEPRIIETARGIQKLGAHVIKLALTPGDLHDNRSLVQLASEDPSIRAVLNMPFPQVVLWAQPQAARGHLFDAASLGIEYSELNDLTRYLRMTFRGTGRTFYLGNWEGDWQLTRDGKREPSSDDVAALVAWGLTRQKAIDDAKAETPDSDVRVFFYIEVNLVRDAEAGKTRLTNAVLPKVNPDFVSYSSYDTTQPNQGSMIEFRRALDVIQSELHPKIELPQKRVFVGEFGFKSTSVGAEKQDKLSKRVIAAALEWGCPLILYWEFYNNEVENGVQKGFWMIDDKGKKQPIYFTFQHYYLNAQKFVQLYLKLHQSLPSELEFEEEAEKWLQ